MMGVREKLVGYGIKTVKAGLVAGAGGNISAREGNTVWMKPTGVAMDDMGSDDLCGMDLETGEQLSGDYQPTSEVIMHLAIYKARPEIASVFHTHSPWASGVISAGVEIRPMFAEFVCDLGRTGTVPYVTPTTVALAEVVADKMRECDTIFMVNHGVVAVGLTIREAYYRVVVVEDAAKSLVAATVVGKPSFLSQAQVDEILSLDAVELRKQRMGDRG